MTETETQKLLARCEELAKIWEFEKNWAFAPSPFATASSAKILKALRQKNLQDIDWPTIDFLKRDLPQKQREANNLRLAYGKAFLDMSEMAGALARLSAKNDLSSQPTLDEKHVQSALAKLVDKAQTAKSKFETAWHFYSLKQKVADELLTALETSLKTGTIDPRLKVSTTKKTLSDTGLDFVMAKSQSAPSQEPSSDEEPAATTPKASTHIDDHTAHTPKLKPDKLKKSTSSSQPQTHINANDTDVQKNPTLPSSQLNSSKVQRATSTTSADIPQPSSMAPEQPTSTPTERHHSEITPLPPVATPEQSVPLSANPSHSEVLVATEPLATSSTDKSGVPTPPRDPLFADILKEKPADSGLLPYHPQLRHATLYQNITALTSQLVIRLRTSGHVKSLQHQHPALLPPISIPITLSFTTQNPADSHPENSLSEPTSSENALSATAIYSLAATKSADNSNTAPSPTSPASETIDGPQMADMPQSLVDSSSDGSVSESQLHSTSETDSAAQPPENSESTSSFHYTFKWPSPTPESTSTESDSDKESLDISRKETLYYESLANQEETENLSEEKSESTANNHPVFDEPEIVGMELKKSPPKMKLPPNTVLVNEAVSYSRHSAVSQYNPALSKPDDDDTSTSSAAPSKPDDDTSTSSTAPSASKIVTVKLRKKSATIKTKTRHTQVSQPPKATPPASETQSSPFNPKMMAVTQPKNALERAIKTAKDEPKKERQRR